ncbi:MAG: cellulase family glycosylhydrolase, partial [Simkania negevensis]|nr:cellulase family glycosylhydrolase [Simkania negevensis]
EVDPITPVILDTGLYATPWAIDYLSPSPFTNIIYSFHMYEPYAYTTRKINNGRFSYPGYLPLLIDDAQEENKSPVTLIRWDKKALGQFLNPISSWQEKYHIPSSQILVGEFGCDRLSLGTSHYLQDLIQIFDSKNWHWAFYSFREDCWDSMDYELGDSKLSWKYWETAREGQTLDSFRKSNPLFEVLKGALEKPKNLQNTQR